MRGESGWARALHDISYRRTASAVVRLVIHLLFAFYNGALSVRTQSAWLGVSCVYYLLLSVSRFGVVLSHSRRASGFTGILLLLLSPVVAASLYISLRDRTATVYGLIPMLTVTTYTFTKSIAAIVGAIRRRRSDSASERTVSAIRYAEIAVSVVTMQQSMLVSFGGASEATALALNIFTGTAAWMTVTACGAVLLYPSERRKATVAKARGRRAMLRVADCVTNVYKSIERTVVRSYKSVENAVVGMYQRIETAFIKRYLTRDGETPDEARARLKQERK